MSGRKTCLDSAKYPSERAKFCVITLKSTRLGAEHMANLPQHFLHAHIGPRITSSVVTREYSSLSFSPGCQGLPPPSIQLNFDFSMMALTQASSTKSIMRQCPAGRASPGKGNGILFHG